ncbi:MAG: helix-turn-helix transcriptional regulator [Oscillibacter sp.]|nr:helix-turn-helix transcriptional regulator [Oscillibacter sp.]
MFYNIKKSSERIHQLRVQSGYTQKQLAEELNINQSFLSRIESGQKGCSVDLFIQFSLLFRVSLDVLILGQEREDCLKAEKTAQLKENIAGLINQLTEVQKQL